MRKTCTRASPEQYVTSSDIDRQWEVARQAAGTEEEWGMLIWTAAILVLEVLSYRHFLGLDDDSCDSRVLCDHSHSFSVCVCVFAEDKHLNVNFSWEIMHKWDRKQQKNYCLVFQFTKAAVFFFFFYIICWPKLMWRNSLKPSASVKLQTLHRGWQTH